MLRRILCPRQVGRNVHAGSYSPKTGLLYLLVLIVTTFRFLDARARVFLKHAIEALRGSARPGRGLNLK